MTEVFIVDALRTGIGNFAGSLAAIGAAELGRTVVAELQKRNALEGSEIDEVIFGNVLQAGLGQNVARQIALGANIPASKTAMSVNMVCGSGLRTVALAAQAIRCQDAQVVVAGGCESMSNAPYLLKQARAGYRMGNGELVDSMIADGLWDVFNNVHMGITAENLADKYQISRQEQDEFACASQNKAEKAIQEKRFASEIVPVSIPQKKGEPVLYTADEFPRAGTTLDSLAKLRAAFKKDGTVTAGNASGVNDGAAAVLVASEAVVKKQGWHPMGRIVSYAWHGTDPAIMGIGPVEAVRKALSKANWTLNSVDLIEANEAFAAQSLAVARELKWRQEIVNVNGGAIALGHPIGASGTRILVTLLHEMRRRQVKRGLATLCIGGGMGIALCVESVV